MILDSFVQLIFNVYEAFTVALFVRDGKVLSCSSAVTFAKSFDKSKAVPLEGTLPGWAVKHKEPLIIGNFDKDEETLGYYGKKEEIKAFMAYPLEIPGVIVVDSKKKWTFTDKEKKILAHFVTVLAKELEREKRIRDMEEEHERLSLTRRVIGFLREPLGDDASVVDEILKEGLAASGADSAFAGIARKGQLRIVGAAGTGAAELKGARCPAQGTIASTVIEGGTEFLLPYESGYLREKPLLFQNEAIRVRQYFGFPLKTEDTCFGFAGFASLSARQLREGSISVLRDAAVVLSLHLARLNMREEMEAQRDREPVTGALRFKSFFDGLAELAHKKREFSVVSIKLLNFDRYNRSLGMDFTDDVLRKMHQSIEYCVGSNAMITRSEGGHFFAAVDGSDVMEGENILNILRFTIVKNISTHTTSPKAVIELGTASFPRDGRGLWDILDTAERRGKATRTA
jgi:GGDEF domain-containing protein